MNICADEQNQYYRVPAVLTDFLFYEFEFISGNML